MVELQDQRCDVFDFTTHHQITFIRDHTALPSPPFPSNNAEFRLVALRPRDPLGRATFVFDIGQY